MTTDEEWEEVMIQLDQYEPHTVNEKYLVHFFFYEILKYISINIRNMATMYEEDMV